MRTRILIALGVLGAALLVLSIRFYRDQMVWAESAAYGREAPGPARSLVVYYSRSGNTAGAAKEAARYFQADVLQILAPQYGLDLEGSMRAGEDADQGLTTTPIEHEPVDLSRYELVVLCSPTWWFRPAVPLWSFVEDHDFGGARVFLVMTGNSRLKQENVALFADLVEQNGGVFLDNLFLRRGRYFWQRSMDEVLGELREELEVRGGLWPPGATPR